MFCPCTIWVGCRSTHRREVDVGTYGMRVERNRLVVVRDGFVVFLPLFRNRIVAIEVGTRNNQG